MADPTNDDEQDPFDLDPYDDKHYASVESFVGLLRSFGYLVQEGEDSAVNVEVDSDHPPIAIYTLGQFVHEAVNRGLFDGEVAGSDGHGHPFSATLYHANNTDNIEHRTPLWQLAKEPVDYFRLVDDIPVVIISFDFDTPEGILATEELMNNSIVYVDYEGKEGPEDAVTEHLEHNPVRVDDEEVLESDLEDSDLRQVWLDIFDLEFDLARGLADEHIIVHCVSPKGQGYPGDRQYFLMEMDAFEELRIPDEWRVSVN